MAGAAEEAEVLAEVEAVRAVYGEDCRVLRPFPPHVDVYIRPRTADDSSQQFVEAVLGIRAGAQYPDEPPCIILVESKGLDEKRQEHLTAVLQNKAQELSSWLMLVALCEEAVEVLSNMNHPDGNCPLCTHVSVSQRLGNCPVCRMVFHSKDIEHVLDLLETCMPEVSFEVTGPEDGGEPEVLRSDAENTRRQKFDSLLKLQQENSGLIEPKKDLVVAPGMFLPERVTHPTASSGNSIEHTEDGQFNVMPGADLNNTSSTPTTNGQKGSSARRGRAPNPRKHVNAQASRKQWSAQPSRKQWIKKENGLDN